MMLRTTSNILLLLCLVAALVGCAPNGKEVEPAKSASSDDAAESKVQTTVDSVGLQAPKKKEAELVELNAQELLQQRLPLEESSAGWIRLFDGMTLFGLQMTGDAWRIEDGVLVADSGEKGLLCTNSRWSDYKLSVEFKCSAKTNSGIFLRTPLLPTDPETDCYELNIAPADNPFPTASLVNRMKVAEDAVENFDFSEWHRYEVDVIGGTVNVMLDGKAVLQYEDPNPLPAGLVGFQFREGPISFRDIRLKPLGFESLLSEKIEDNWKRYPEMEGDYQMTDDGLQITGGRAQLESEQQFGNFALLAEVRTNAKDLNSGIFFRCIPGDQMMGYECQISNMLKGDNPFQPGDCGTGGFFRRSDARVVAAEDEQWFSMLLLAEGPMMSAWVNGLQVSEWTDTRDENENPRKGLRVAAGTLMLQAHDPTTNIHVRKLDVVSFDKTPDKSAVETSPKSNTAIQE